MAWFLFFGLKDFSFETDTFGKKFGVCLGKQNKLTDLTEYDSAIHYCCVPFVYALRESNGLNDLYFFL